jgi:hypothetical protein
MLEAFGGRATFMVSAGHSLDLPGSCQPSQCLDHRLARCAQSPCNGCRPHPKLMKMKGFRGHALIAWGSRGVRQNSRKRKFGFGSNSLRSGPPNHSYSLRIRFLRLQCAAPKRRAQGSRRRAKTSTPAVASTKQKGEGIEPSPFCKRRAVPAGRS